MNILGEPRAAAREAVASSSSRPAMAVLHDTADVRQLVFRILTGVQTEVDLAHLETTQVEIDLGFQHQELGKLELKL